MRWWLPLLAACAAGPGDPRPTDPADTGGATTSAGTATKPPDPTWTLGFTADAERPDPDDVDQHHASVAWADGWWVGYQHGAFNRVRHGSVAGWDLVHDSDPVPFTHPQLEGGDGYVLGVSQRIEGGLIGVAWTPDGAELAGPTWFDLGLTLFPDVAQHDGRGVAVWSTFGALECASFDGAIEALAEIPCPALLDPAHAAGTLSVDLGPDRGWMAWSEAGPGTPATVALAAFDPEHAGIGVPLAAVINPSWDGRPDVATTATGGLVVWRGAESPTVPSSAWLHAFTDPTDPVAARRLGGLGSDRPVVAAAHPIAVVAWEEAGAIWVELLSAPDGAALQAPVQAATVDAGAAARPSVALHPTGEGWTGLLSWELTPTEGARQVWTRTFAIGQLATR